MSWLPLAVLALSVHAAVPAVKLTLPPVRAGFTAPLHPLIAGSLSDPESPILKSLSFHAAELLDGKEKPLGVRVGERFASQDGLPPVDALAQKLIVMTVSRPETALKLLEVHPDLARTPFGRLIAAASDDGADLPPALHGLAAAASEDPTASFLFDGGRKAPLEVDSLVFKRGRLRHEGKKVRRLGFGQFGVVDEHPKIDGAILKTVELAFEITLLTPTTPAEAAAAEEKMARRLAQAGVGPRYFARVLIQGRSSSVREEVYGDTLEKLIHDRRFGAAEEDLVVEMLRRMAAGDIKVDDMRAPNIMIGHTLADPTRRAYLVDGGQSLQFTPGLTEEQKLDELLEQHIIIRGRFDLESGQEINKIKSFREILADGRKRAETRGFWGRLAEAWRSILDTPIAPVH